MKFNKIKINAEDTGFHGTLLQEPEQASTVENLIDSNLSFAGYYFDSDQHIHNQERYRSFLIEVSSIDTLYFNIDLYQTNFNTYDSNFNYLGNLVRHGYSTHSNVLEISVSSSVKYISYPCYYSDLGHLVCNRNKNTIWTNGLFPAYITYNKRQYSFIGQYATSTSFKDNLKKYAQCGLLMDDTDWDYLKLTSNKDINDLNTNLYSGECRFYKDLYPAGSSTAHKDFYFQGESITFSIYGNSAKIVLSHYKDLNKTLFLDISNGILYSIVKSNTNTLTSLGSFSDVDKIRTRIVTAKINNTIIEFYDWGSSTKLSEIDISDYGFPNPCIGFFYISDKESYGFIGTIYESDTVLYTPKELAIKESLNNRKMQPYEITDGFLKANGGVYLYATSKNMLYKYKIPSGTTSIYVSGGSDFSINEGDQDWCFYWFVNNQNQMISCFAEREYCLTIANYEAEVPEGAVEIWAYAPMVLKLSIDEEDDIDKNISKKVSTLENKFSQSIETPLDLRGSYTWSERILGLRVLADAQGCYFIPYNAMGLSCNRMNGTYGNNYCEDQIHPRPVAGYNTALGIWSYLKNIPLWHTSLPAEGYVEKFDGTQWNGKKWYCYGTSLSTDLSMPGGHNTYTNYLPSFSGLTLYNKATGGGALVSANRRLYNALMDLEDGKLEADLITIEVGANDYTNLGDPWSLDINDFYGALNHCLHNMFYNGVQAQIVILASYPARYDHTNPSNKWDVDYLLNT